MASIQEWIVTDLSSPQSVMGTINKQVQRLQNQAWSDRLDRGQDILDGAST